MKNQKYYTVSQVAQTVGISTKTVKRNIKYLDNDSVLLLDNIQDNIQDSVLDKVPYNTKYLFTQKGLNYFKQKYSCNNEKKQDQVVADAPHQATKNQDDFIKFLQEQIKVKDEQINKLMQENSNFQVLLANANINLLSNDISTQDTVTDTTTKKHSFLHRFRKNRSL